MRMKPLKWSIGMKVKQLVVLIQRDLLAIIASEPAEIAQRKVAERNANQDLDMAARNEWV
jgi:hypothetical protein